MRVVLFGCTGADLRGSEKTKDLTICKNFQKLKKIQLNCHMCSLSLALCTGLKPFFFFFFLNLLVTTVAVGSANLTYSRRTLIGRSEEQWYLPVARHVILQG